MQTIHKASLGVLALALVLPLTFAVARAHDATKYPDLSGQWIKPGRFGDQWDPTKPLGLGQQAPLTAEYQKVLEASLADQKAGGQGGDTRITCRPNGMPRMMTPVRPMAFVVEPTTTYILFEINMPVASTRAPIPQPRVRSEVDINPCLPIGPAFGPGRLYNRNTGATARSVAAGPVFRALVLANCRV